jgi:hypothetical protein
MASARILSASVSTAISRSLAIPYMRMSGSMARSDSAR